MRAAPTGIVDFVADIICPWCAIGRRRLEQALATLAKEGLSLDWVWRPFLLYPDAPPGGFKQDAHLLRRFGSHAAADAYHAGVAEAGRAVGFDFRYERMTLTPDTMPAHRLVSLAAEAGHQAAVAEALAQAFFTEGRDIGATAVLAEVAAACGMDADAVRAMLDGPRFRSEVAAADAAAKRAGIRQVPTFCLHGRILDIRDPGDLAEALRTAHRALAPG